MSDRPRFQYSLRTLFIATAIAAGSFSVATSLLRPRAPEWLITFVAILLFATFCFILYIHIISTTFCDTRPIDPLSPQRLASFISELQAEALVEALAAEDIRALAVGGYTAGFRAEAPGEVQVVVASKDLSRAKEILEAFENVENKSRFGQGSAETEE